MQKLLTKKVTVNRACARGMRRAKMLCFYIWPHAKTPYQKAGGYFAYTLGYTLALKIAKKASAAPSINP